MKNAQKPRKPVSSIVWRGPSRLNGAPIVVVAIIKSTNGKTGNMVQTYILPDSPLHLIDLQRTGQDAAICGNCPHRGNPVHDAVQGLAAGRTCYVNIGQGARAVHDKVQGRAKPGKPAPKPYPDVSGNPDAIRAIGAGRMVRIGTYGDGAAVPDELWQTLTADAEGLTAYTHQGTHQNPLYMQSADSIDAARQAHAAGRRTFRVIPITAADAPLLPNEVMCPSSRGIECKDCRLCDGRKAAKSVAIVAHGPTASKFKGADHAA